MEWIELKVLNLSGGIGVFSGRVPQVWMTKPAANTGVTTIFAGSWMMDFDGIDIRDYYDGLNLQLAY